MNYFFLFSILILVPSFSMANAGTPLLWVSALHLVFGNAIIGVIEGLILAKLLKIAKLRSVMVMIVANYTSAVMGVGFLQIIDMINIESIQYFFFEYLKVSITVIIIAIIVLTIFIEVPFCYFLEKKSHRGWKSAFRASLIIQTVSYILISPIYLKVSNFEISPPWEVRKISSARNVKGFILFLNNDGKSVSKINLESLFNNQLLENWDTKVFNGYLYVDLENKSDLNLKIIGSSDEKLKKEIDFSLKSTIPSNRLDHKWFDRFKMNIEIKNKPDFETTHVQSHFKECFREEVDYSAGKNIWKVDWIGTWAAEGFRFSKKSNSKETIGMSVESPPFWWAPSCVTILQDDQVVMEYGPYILFLDLKNRIAFPVGIGRSPVVILENKD